MSYKATVVFITFMFSCLWVFPANADIYQYTDKNGVVHFTNVTSGKKYKRVKREPTRVRKQKAVTRPAVPARSFTPSGKLPNTYDALIQSACSKYGVDPSLVQAIVSVESNFNPYALSRKGAMGLMQLMPRTAAELKVKNSFNPRDNINGGVKYLRYLMDRYEGNLRLTLAAYNAGETAVRQWGTVPPYRETQRYVKKVLRIYNGEGRMFTPQYTIYIGHGNDGSLTITDNPSSHGKNKLRRKRVRTM